MREIANQQKTQHLFKFGNTLVQIICVITPKIKILQRETFAFWFFYQEKTHTEVYNEIPANFVNQKKNISVHSLLVVLAKVNNQHFKPCVLIVNKTLHVAIPKRLQQKNWMIKDTRNPHICYE